MSGLDREAAREAARQELSRREYEEAQPSLLLRALGGALRELGELLDRLTAAAPTGPLGVVLLVLIVGLVVAAVLARIGPLRRGDRSPQLFSGSPSLSADGHRALADAAAREGRWADAVRERLRAVVRELEARGVLDPRPGRTAGEVGREAGAAVPALADDLTRATRLFDEVWYGGRTADARSYAVLVDVDQRVTSSRLAVAP